MISNPVQPIAPAIPPTPMATPSHMPSKWAPPYNVSVFGPGIPLNSFDQNDKNDDNDKKKKKRRKGKKKEKVPLGPYPVVSPGMQIYLRFLYKSIDILSLKWDVKGLENWQSSSMP